MTARASRCRNCRARLRSLRDVAADVRALAAELEALAERLCARCGQETAQPAAPDGAAEPEPGGAA